MASAYIEGKVLVIITDHKSSYPSIHAYPQSAVGKDHAGSMDALYTDMPEHLMQTKGYGLSKKQMAMPEGTVFRIAMTVVLSYHSDYWGEWDSKLEIVKSRTLRVQKPNRKLLKRWKLQERQEAKKQKAKEFAEALKKIDLILPAGESNKIFEDISELDRAAGRVRLSDLH